MPERKRQRRAQASRNDSRQGVAAAYEQLARLEAERTALLAIAVHVAERHRAAQEAARQAESDVAAIAEDLAELGMDLGDVAKTIDMPPAELRRIMDERGREHE